MSNYRVKHFANSLLDILENDVNEFIEKHEVEVLKYTLTPVDNRGGGMSIHRSPRIRGVGS